MDPSNKSKMNFGKKEADEHSQKTYRYEERGKEFIPPKGMPRKEKPKFAFNLKFPSWDEFYRALWKKSNGSSPGLNGNGYLIYKRCKGITRKLFLLQKKIWEKKSIPKEWKVVRVKLLPKTDDTSHPSKVRPISVINVEGRMFWTMYQYRMSEYFLQNEYIDLRIQKGFLKKVAGCVEHSMILWEALKEFQKKKRAICGVFLDLANAYGSVSHNMIQFALKWYHVPKHIAELLFNYYEGVCSQVHEEEWKSEWFRNDIGSLQGCTASTVIFIVAFQLLLDIHEWQMELQKVNSGITIPDTEIKVSKPSYADDIALVERTPQNLQTSVDAFSKLVWMLLD